MTAIATITTHHTPPTQHSETSSANLETEDPRAFDRRGVRHGMLSAGHVRNRWAVAWRHIVLKFIGALPATRFKTRLLARLFKMKLGRDVGIASGVFLDPYDPSMITIGDRVVIGFESRIFVHAFTLTRQRVRPVTIGNDVMIGGFCIIAPGVTIGNGASIAPGTVVSRNVPPGAIAMGNPMQLRRRALASSTTSTDAT